MYLRASAIVTTRLGQRISFGGVAERFISESKT
jgi:hypothetical protein